jgi:putative toxin-antitoxin system antitoxin component (TIGR02293 family)
VPGAVPPRQPDLAPGLKRHAAPVILPATGDGIGLRTYQRRKDAPDKRLSLEQSGRTWKFAEVLGRAIELFGSQPEAEEWLERPAMALEQRRPIDLLSTPAGVESIENHLTRLEYGVYT